MDTHRHLCTTTTKSWKWGRPHVYGHAGGKEWWIGELLRLSFAAISRFYDRVVTQPAYAN